MIQAGAEAPRFSLVDQFGRVVDSNAYRGRSHLVLVFYPLDFTPT